MTENCLTELTNKILDILRESGIEKKDSLEALYNIYAEVEFSMWEKINLNVNSLNELKDLIFYNLEHLEKGGPALGVSDLNLFGTVFPNFIYLFDGLDYMENEKLPSLLKELEEIISKWDKNWRLAKIYAKAYTEIKNDEEIKVIFHNRNESPAKYAKIISTKSTILGPDGNNIKKEAEQYIYCMVDVKIGEYIQGTIMKDMLLTIRDHVRKAIESGKGIKLEMEQ
jgi:hypothetical protein